MAEEGHPKMMVAEEQNDLMAQGRTEHYCEKAVGVEQLLGLALLVEEQEVPLISDLGLVAEEALVLDWAVAVEQTTCAPP